MKNITKKIFKILLKIIIAPVIFVLFILFPDCFAYDGGFTLTQNTGNDIIVTNGVYSSGITNITFGSGNYDFSTDDFTFYENRNCSNIQLKFNDLPVDSVSIGCNGSFFGSVDRDFHITSNSGALNISQFDLFQKSPQTGTGQTSSGTTSNYTPFFNFSDNSIDLQLAFLVLGVLFFTFIVFIIYLLTYNFYDRSRDFDIN